MEAKVYFDEGEVFDILANAIEEEVDLDEVAKEVAAEMLDDYMPREDSIREMIQEAIQNEVNDALCEYVSFDYHNAVVKNLSARCDGLATELVGCLKAIEALESKTNPILAFFRRLFA